MELFEEERRGVWKEVSLPAYGRQDVGITPGGAMDRFAFDCGNALVGNPEDAPALEMLVPPVLTAKEHVYLVLTGAAFANPRMRAGGRDTPLEHGVVHFALPGTEFHFGPRKSGLRSYLCFRKAEGPAPEEEMLSRRLDVIAETAGWTDNENLIRVIEGPEFPYLRDPERFFDARWTVSRDVSDMGMRLESAHVLTVELENMISEAVTTGTIQATPAGPILLLTHRQTVGGYPRVFAAISADVDLLAQYVPGQEIRFRNVTIEEAWAAARRKRGYIFSLRERFSS